MAPDKSGLTVARVEKLFNSVEASRIPHADEQGARAEIQRFRAYVFGKFGLLLTPVQAITIWELFASFGERPQATKWTHEQWQENMRLCFEAFANIYSDIESQLDKSETMPEDATP